MRVKIIMSPKIINRFHLTPKKMKTMFSKWLRGIHIPITVSYEKQIKVHVHNRELLRDVSKSSSKQQFWLPIQLTYIIYNKIIDTIITHKNVMHYRGENYARQILARFNPCYFFKLLLLDVCILQLAYYIILLEKLGKKL